MEFNKLYHVVKSLNKLKESEVNVISLAALSALLLASDKTGRGGVEPGRIKKEVASMLASFSPDLNSLKEYTNELAEALVSNGYGVKVCEIKSEWRSVVGSSEPVLQIPFEVGLFWDPVFNVPFIPGTSIKGAVRGAFEELLMKEVACRGPASAEDVKKEAERVFGAAGRSPGLVGFTDAYPVSKDAFLLEPDVVTPHYPGKKNELEAQPVPNVFVTIARGVTFRFFVFYAPPQGIPGKRVVGAGGLRFARELGGDSGRADMLLGNLAERWNPSLSPRLVPLLDRAVLYAFARGVGAKTSLGYSRFMVVRYEEYRGSR